MAWTTVYPAGGGATTGGSSSGVVTFDNPRVMRGTVQMRLTDVTFASGYQFTQFFMNVQLITAGGAVLASGQLTKVWGVSPGFTTLGVINPANTMRIRIASSSYYTQNQGGMWYDFKSELRWDNSGAV